MVESHPHPTPTHLRLGVNGISQRQVGLPAVLHVCAVREEEESESVRVCVCLCARRVQAMSGGGSWCVLTPPPLPSPSPDRYSTTVAYLLPSAR